MTKLNQIIAVSNGKKSRTQSSMTELYHKLQKSPLLSGIARTYRPKDDDGEQLPPESNRVLLQVKDIIKEASTIWTELFDAIATQDTANCSASADVCVDGEVLLADVPVTHLLFLEKQLNDIHSFVSKVPTLDPAYEWEWSDEANCYATKPTETTRTKKIPRNHVKYEATKEHPAQVEMFTEDVLVGYWTKVDFSGAMLEKQKNQIVNRVRQLQEAVKQAREDANNTDVVLVENGKVIFGFLFETTAS